MVSTETAAGDSSPVRLVATASAIQRLVRTRVHDGTQEEADPRDLK